MKKETDDIQDILSELKKSRTDKEKLKEEIKRRGLEKKAGDFEARYKDQINDFIGKLNEKGNISSEEKAAMVLEMKNKLTSSQQKQFNAVLNALKKYLKNK